VKVFAGTGVGVGGGVGVGLIPPPGFLEHEKPDKRRIRRRTRSFADNNFIFMKVAYI
jgi:hypothetical protein